MRVDRHASVLPPAKSPSCPMMRSLSTDDKGQPNSLRVRAYRSDPDGGLLGPLNATHFAVGDVAGPAQPVAARRQRARRGSHQPAPVQPGRLRPHAFRRRAARRLGCGALSQWRITCICRADGSQRYVFEDVPLLYGDNRFDIVLYGPQGQIREAAWR